MVAALGQGASLVGVTHACTVPTGSPAIAVTRSLIPDGTALEIDRAVSQTYEQGAPLFQLDENAIARLQPDLILTQALCEVCAISETDVRSLATRLPHTPRIETLSGSTIDGIFNDLQAVARAMGIPEEGAELEAGLRVRMRKVHRKLKAARAPRPTVAFIEWTDPVYAAGHWVPEMIHRAGGRDVVAAPGEHSRRRTIEDIITTDPDVVMIAPCGYDLDRAALEGSSLFGNPEWRWLDSRNVWALHADALTSRPGLGLVDGIEAIARVLHPAIFSTPLPQYARRLSMSHAA